MILQRHFTLACFFLLATPLFSQLENPCGSEYFHQKKLATDPVYRQLNNQFELKYLELLNSAAKGAAAADFTLPVVVHIIHENGNENISDALVQAGIQHLNESFANMGYYDNGNGVDTKIQFCLARRDPDGLPTSGITRDVNVLTNMIMETEDIALKNINRWDPTKYINIWLVKEITSDASGAGVAGYAYFPGAHGSNVDGLVFEARWMGSSNSNSCVATHEMGHYLGLYHTFQGGCTNADCSIDGDRVCDTPPDASTAAVPCAGSANSCTTDTQSGFATDQNDMHINYMDYGDWKCYNAFTSGQQVRMEASILGTRKSLLTSKACINPCTTPFKVSFKTSSNNVPVGSAVNFFNTSQNGATWEWSIDGTTWSTDKDTYFTFNMVGTYFIRLRAKGTDITCEGEAFDSVKVFCPVIPNFDILTTNFIAGDNIPLNSVSSGGSILNWTINGVPSSTVKFWNWIPAAPGFYNICLEVSNGLCNESICHTVEVVCDVDASISIWKLNVMVGENLPVASSSANATTLNWTLNGVQHSTAAGFNLNFSNSGVYVLCLSASNGACTDTECIQIEAIANPCPNPPCVEDCANGVDDDLDGLVDCFDASDCECNPVPDCKTNEFDQDFGVKLAWRGSKKNVSAIASPMVANLDPQNGKVAEIIVPEYVASGSPKRFFIFQGDGSNKDNPDILDIPQGFTSYPVSVPCIADLDRDGKPELMMISRGDAKIRIYKNFQRNVVPCMSVWMTAVAVAGDANYHVYAADFDGNGLAELYAGNEVYYFDFANPAAPTLQRMPVTTGHVGESNSSFANDNASSVAYDLLTRADCGGDPDCDGLEIAAGAVIYSVDLDPGDGDGRQIKIQRNLSSLVGGTPFGDGYTTIGDLDLNGIPEVVVAGSRGNKVGIYAWNKTGFWTLFPNQGTSTSGCGTPCIANVYDDKTAGFATDFPEVIMANEDNFTCFNLHKAIQTPTKPFWWNLKTTDYSGYTGATTFDFNGDKQYEIVYRDEDSLRIMYGGAQPFPPGVLPNRNWAAFPSYSITADEYPVIADVDGDGQAEITYTANPDSGQYRPYEGMVYVLESDEANFGPWLSARPVWNQFNYFVTNINDDLTVPKTQQLNHIEIPTVGSGKRPLNNFLFQLPIYDENFEPYLPLSDATLKLQGGDCLGDSFLLKIKICNTGSAALNDSLPITFYTNGNPFTDASAVKITTVRATGGGIAIDSCGEFVVKVPILPGQIFGVFNDFGGFTPPLPPDSAFLAAECDYLNNWDTLSFKNISPSPDLGPDIHICESSVFEFNAGSGFKTYRWQDGSADSTFTAWESGKYWVEVSDNCGNLKRDTVQIIIDAAGGIDLGDDQVFCPSNVQPIQLNVPGFSEYKWTPATGLSCTACPNPTITPTAAEITYKVVAKNAGNCVAIDSITISLHDSVLVQIIGSACVGKNFEFAGHQVLAGETEIFSGQTAHGCDSMTRIQVLELPISTTSGAKTICPGTTTDVFGQNIGAAGVFSKIFKNKFGCDSTHTMTVEMFDAPVPTAENRKICPGTTTLVFGEIKNTAGVFSKTFQNPNGCDSTHTISVEMFPVPVPTSEKRQICTGDTTIVFGQIKTAAGVFSKIFQNGNGCDSMHTIAVEVFPTAIPTSENRKICPGTTTQVFGQTISTAGVFSKTFQNPSGCDSIHTISVEVFPLPNPTSENRKICPGETTNVFGEIKNTAGVFSKTFKNGNGCDSTHTISVEMFAAPLPTTETRKICPGETTDVFGQNIGTAGVFPKTFKNQNGCDSTHTISVSLFPQPVPTSESREICPGDTTIIFGDKIFTAGNFSKTFQNANGCDSTHAVAVKMLPGSQPTVVLHKICPGDTIYIYGVAVAAVGSFPKHFANPSGCDSLHTEFVEIFPAPVPSFENRKICPGDFTNVFGQNVGAAGVFPKIFQNQNGCDSTHTISVEMFAAPVPSFENRKICPGDFTDIFGQNVGAAGVFPKTFQNGNGCDSTHTISVSLFPQPVPSFENRKICPGDTVLVFGEMKTIAGIFEKIFQNGNGCDSSATISVAMLPKPAPIFQPKHPGCDELNGGFNLSNVDISDDWNLDGTSFFPIDVPPPPIAPGSHQFSVKNSDGCVSTLDFEINLPPPSHFKQDSVRICEGESIVVFGQTVSKNGVFEKTLANQFGCDSILSKVVLVTSEPKPSLEIVQPTCLDTLGKIEILNFPADVSASLDGGVSVLPSANLSVVFEKLSWGNHVIQFNREGCIYDHAIFFPKPVFPKVVLPGDTLINFGESVEITPQIFPQKQFDFVWSPADWLNCTDCPEPLATPFVERVEYQLVITDALGCTATDRMVIKVKTDPNIYIPNVFSPDDDGDNETFTIYASEKAVRKILWLKIFDRWGNQVFENFDFPPNDETKGWNGFFRSQAMNPAVFAWEAEVELASGQLLFLEGDVTLVRK